MLIEFSRQAPEQDIGLILEKLLHSGFKVFRTKSCQHTVIVTDAVEDLNKFNLDKDFEKIKSVKRIVNINTSYQLASKSFKETNTIVKVGELEIGGGNIHVMAGPCAVESREQLFKAAHAVKASGAAFLRGGAFKPRTSPYSFQGLNEKGLELLAEARAMTGLKVVTEVMDTRSVKLVAGYADILQIGARNMQNFNLLREVGKVNNPVLLKRGSSATIEEWLTAAEYILSSGNENVILCERGMRGVNEFTRYTLDIAAVPVLKELTHLPVIVDPSHGTGHWRYVSAMSLASIAAGADGLIIEVHPDPEKALCDGSQSLTPKKFKELMACLVNMQDHIYKAEKLKANRRKVNII